MGAVYGDVATWQQFKDDGELAANWKLYTYDAGTTTPRPTYTDIAGTIPNSNPVIFDSRGEAVILFNGSYKLVLKDDLDNTIWTRDNYTPEQPASIGAIGNLIVNGSFETDTIGAGNPDDWVITTGDTTIRDATVSTHGAASMKFVNAGAGGGIIESSDFFEVSAGRTLPVSFGLLSSGATVRNIVEMLWYTEAQIALGTPKTTVMDDSTTNPTSWTHRFYSITPPAGAKYGKIRIQGATASGIPGTTWFDDVVVMGVASDNLIVPGTTTLNGTLGVTGVSTLSSLLKTSKGADVASATALVLGTDGNFFDVTGTTTITSIGSLGIGTEVTLQFDDILTLTHNATNLILPSGQNITTYAGMVLKFVEYATGNWVMTGYNQSVKDLQTVVTSSTTSTVVTGTIPQDGSIPQVGEGTLVFTRTITPIDAANYLEIEVLLNVINSAASVQTATALFKDGAADAVAAVAVISDNAANPVQLVLKHRRLAGSTSEQTYTVRYGTATGSTATMNPSTLVGAGMIESSITIKEVAP